MQSKFHKKFNHNNQAEGYDKDVEDESNPIREGYGDLLEWVKKKCTGSKDVIDLGAGTGNLAVSLSDKVEKITCVDVSEKMIQASQEKLKGRNNIFFIKSDILNFFSDNDFSKVDTVVSTYALHHLTQKEKYFLLEEIYKILPKGGRFVFGDLMFKDRNYKEEMEKKYPSLIEDFENEFFWYIEEDLKKIEEIGFNTEIEKFSDLSWGIYGTKN